AGARLQNYHFFFDLFAAEIYRLARVPILDLYFRFLPLFLGWLQAAIVFILGWRWSGEKKVGVWSVILICFASSWGWLLPLVGLGSNNWETAFWAMQPATGLQNPPFFLSLILLGAGLLLFWHFLKEKSWRFILILALLWGGLVQIKIYSGLVLLAALGSLAIGKLVFARKKKLLILWLVCLGISLLLYLPFNQLGGSFVNWEPGWFVRIMIQAGDRVNWVDLELRRQAYLAGGNKLAVMMIDFLSVVIFIVGNLGIRVIGFFYLGRKLLKRKPLGNLGWLFLLIFTFAILPPLLFTQRFLPWNTIQFFYYAIFIFSFFASREVVSWQRRIKKPALKIILGILLVVLAVPGSLKTISWHWSQPSTSVLDNQEQAALEFIKEQNQGSQTILTYPYVQPSGLVIPPPVPLSYYNAAYVSFFTASPVYLEDHTAALIQGYDYQNRLEKSKWFFSTNNLGEAKDFLSKNKIGYVYLVDGQQWQAKLEDLFELVYENNRARVYHLD
ncbi:hypothetical protein ACFLZP_03700, partial [Patescibacteria group bacterium]